MRKLTIVLFTIFTINAKAQSANAGRDVTIYLTSTSTATLNGSASTGTSFLWREISTDFMSGAIISSPTSKTTTVTGFLPGTFYFEIAATKGATTKTDSVVVRVDVDAPPAYATLHRFLNLSDPAILHTINWRGDTTNYFLTNNAVHSQMQGADGQRWNLYRDRTNGLMIDHLRGKIRSQIRDGYRAPTDDFARAEIQIDAPSTIIDTNKILMFEWKGYYPNQPLYMHNRNDGIGTIFQIHSNSSNQSSGLGFGLNGDSSITFILYSNDSTFSREATVLVGKYKDWVNRSHTIRITIREGYGYKNHPAFVKLDIDGVQKLIIDTGKIGGTPWNDFSDYSKFGTLYDYGKRITDPENHSRNRSFNLITESFKQYVLTTSPPLVKVGTDQIVVLPTTSATLTSTATPFNTRIVSHEWTKVSGGSATITSPNSLKTTVTGLSKGKYLFNLKATDGNGLVTNVTTTIVVEQNNVIDATGYNYDGVIDPVLKGTVSTLRNNSIDGYGFSFYVKGFSTTSTPLPVQFGLPADGKIISQSNTLYQMQPYNSNNTLRLNSGQTGTLTLTTSVNTEKVMLLLNSGNCNLGYQVNYSDASHDNGVLSVPDWGCTTCGINAIAKLGRVDNSGKIESDYWSMAEDSIITNPSKLISSITFSPTGSWVNIFALSQSNNVIVYPIVKRRE